MHIHFGTIEKITSDFRQLWCWPFCDAWKVHYQVGDTWSAWPEGGLLRARRTKGWNRKTEVWKRIFLFKRKLGGGNANIFFSHLFGEDSHFDSYFWDGLKPPTREMFSFHVKFSGKYLLRFRTIPVFWHSLKPTALPGNGLEDAPSLLGTKGRFSGVTVSLILKLPEFLDKRVTATEQWKKGPWFYRDLY